MLYIATRRYARSCTSALQWLFGRGSEPLCYLVLARNVRHNLQPEGPHQFVTWQTVAWLGQS